MNFPAIFAIVVGMGMIAQWAMSFFNHQIPELKTEPLRIAFHIAGEMLTAVLLVISGLPNLGRPPLPACSRHAALHRHRQSGLFCPERADHLAVNLRCAGPADHHQRLMVGIQLAG